MNKKFTFFLASALMASSLQMKSQVVISSSEVPQAEWKTGSYYFLKTGNNEVLSLHDGRVDSVIVKNLASMQATKSSIDLALWEVTNAGTTPAGVIYQFKNKKTKALLSFPAKLGTVPVLGTGVDKFTFAPNGRSISGFWGTNQQTGLQVNGGKLSLINSVPTSTFTVFAPDTAYVLKATELGDGFTIIKLSFGGQYEGNIFENRDLLVKDASAGYVSLQVRGDESFPDGKAKYIGVDTTKNNISGAMDVYGARFALDSTRFARRPNLNHQHFQFTADLRNDSLGMFVHWAPFVNGNLGDSAMARVVKARLDDKMVLTVARYDAAANNRNPQNGESPLIRVEKGVPASISTGSGVYYLKSASRGPLSDRYFTAYNAAKDSLVSLQGRPSEYNSIGQWYIKEESGKYSVVDRNTNTVLSMNQEIFAVQGMPNTYTFGGRTDSIVIEHKPNVDFSNKFLGSKRFTEKEIAENGYLLNLISGTPGVTNDLFVFTNDSILKVGNDRALALPFRILLKEDSIKNIFGIGAQALGDTLYHATYTLMKRFSSEMVTSSPSEAMKWSSSDAALVFTFYSALEGDRYSLTSESGKNAFVNVTSSVLSLSDNVNYFAFIPIAAPDYASFESNHKKLSTNGKYLALNALNLFAEVRNVGQSMLRSTYVDDHFKLFLQRTERTIPNKATYYITSTRRSAVDTVVVVDSVRMAMISLRGLSDPIVNSNVAYQRVGFSRLQSVTGNELALFALKAVENGEYLLENQFELNRSLAAGEIRTPFVSIVNNVVVMSDKGVPFQIEDTDGPVGNESFDTSSVRIISGVGSITLLNAGGKVVTLVNLLGRKLGTYSVDSDNFTLSAPKGIIVVSVEGEKSQKALVK